MFPVIAPAMALYDDSTGTCAPARRCSWGVAMGWGIFDTIGDGLSAGVEAIGDGADAIVKAAEWIGGQIVDGVTYSYGFAGSAASTVVEEVVDKSGWVMGRVADGVGGFYNDWVEPPLRAASTAIVDTATWIAPAIVELPNTFIEVGNWGLETADTFLFDPTSYLSGGLIDVDYGDGNLSAKLGIPDVLYTGGSIGDKGVSYETETVAGGIGVRIDEGGFGANASIGTDFGPLPYVEGHVAISPTGATTVGGEIEITLPTPVGLIEGSADGEATVDGDGVDADLTADGTLITPVGVTIDLDEIDLDDLDPNDVADVLLPDIPTPQDYIDDFPEPEDFIPDIPTPEEFIDDLPRPEDFIPDDPSLDVLFDAIADGQLPTYELPTVELPTVGGFQTPELPTLDLPAPDGFPTIDPMNPPDFDDLPIVSQLPDIVDLPDIQAVFDLAIEPSSEGVLGALAATGDLSDVLREAQGAADSTSNPIEAVVTYIEDGGFDDFTGDIVAAEVNEAAADAVWDDLP